MVVTGSGQDDAVRHGQPLDEAQPSALDGDGSGEIGHLGLLHVGQNAVGSGIATHAASRAGDFIENYRGHNDGGRRLELLAKQLRDGARREEFDPAG